MKTLFKTLLITLCIPTILFSSTIYLRDGQVIEDVENLQEFESVFLYQLRSRNISIPKDRIQKVVDDNGKTIYELILRTMREISSPQHTVMFEILINGQPIAKAHWKEEGRFETLSGTIPDGQYIEYYPSGRTKRVYPFVNGKLDGRCIENYASGIIERESTMVQGLENGVSKNYHQNGRIKGESNFENGKKEGITRLYYESGALHSEMNFKNGLPHGTQKVFYESGELNTEVELVNGVRNGPIKQYYEVGSQKMTGTFLNGKLEGEVTVYYESGRVKSRQMFRNGRIIEG